MSAHDTHLEAAASSAPAFAPSTPGMPATPASAPVATATVSGTPTAAAPSTRSDTLAILDELARIGAVAHEVAAAFGVALDRLSRAEALDRVELDTAVAVEVLGAIATPTFTHWFAVLGDDLRLDFRLRGAGTQDSGLVCAPRAGRAPESVFAAFVAAAELAAATASDDVRVEIRLALAKTRLASLADELLALRAGPAAPFHPDSTHVTLFYTALAWNRLLTLSTAADLERLGIVRDDARTVVVLCDAAGYLAGPALEVLGAMQGQEPRWLSVPPSSWRRFRERAHEVRSLRDGEGSWLNAPRVLTPAHLRVEARAVGLEATAARLAEIRAALSAAYLASSVQPATGGMILLHFAGARPATCRLAGSLADSTLATPDTAVEPAALALLATWAYAHASPDKLAIARECLAHELAAGRDVTLAGLETAAAGALEAAKANFALYLRGNTEQYFRLRQQALDAVTNYAAAVRKAVGDLTADVVDTVYRTVGLLAGVVIAALIQPSLSPLVTRIAAALYTLYMVFLLTFLMPARERRYELESADLDARLAAMPELSDSERRDLRSLPAAERAYFARYFRRSRAIYAGLAALGLVLFLLLLWTPLGAQLTTQAPHAGFTPARAHPTAVSTVPGR